MKKLTLHGNGIKKYLSVLKKRNSMLFFAFWQNSSRFLETLNTPAYKIASFEITDIPLIKYTASKGKPIIISTGIANHDDIDLAVKTCRSVGNNDIALLKCTSSYPSPIDEANISMISDLSSKYKVISGLSDHTMGDTVPIISIALGAKIINILFLINL